jgi:galactitol-specific phosphotransferase system IIB component
MVAKEVQQLLQMQQVDLGVAVQRTATLEEAVEEVDIVVAEEALKTIMVIAVVAEVVILPDQLL